MSACQGDISLFEADEEMFELVKEEEGRQKSGIELIASENFTSRAVMEVLGSVLTNKYSEGEVGKRYYGGTHVIDKIETLCKKRALQAFRLDPDEWHVNVQPLSGSPANFAVYTGLLQPHDRIMGLDLPCGGHLSHGFYTPKKKVSATSVYFESMPYIVSEDSGLIDFDELRKRALIFRPKLIIAGISAYPRDMELKKFREVADEVGAMLLCDMAHIAGLVAAEVIASNPFDFCDIVTSTTHKTLRGPRSGLIFVNKKRLPEGSTKIDQAVFPGLQGGPHNHQIGALAVQLKEVCSPAWKAYAKSVLENATHLGEQLRQQGFKLATGGTDNHMLLVDLRPLGINGTKYEKVCDMVEITLNKNTVPGDKSALNPSGIRIGTSAMTTRGVDVRGWSKVAEMLREAANICLEIQEKLVAEGKTASNSNFLTSVNADNPRIKDLRGEVNKFSEDFVLPGRSCDFCMVI